MVMKPAVIPERVFYHDHPQDAVIEAQSRLTAMSHWLTTNHENGDCTQLWIFSDH